MRQRNMEPSLIGTLGMDHSKKFTEISSIVYEVDKRRLSHEHALAKLISGAAAERAAWWFCCIPWRCTLRGLPVERLSVRLRGRRVPRRRPCGGLRIAPAPRPGLFTFYRFCKRFGCDGGERAA